MKAFVSFVSGALFAIGLAISGMTDPENVRGFLDVLGEWRPQLAFVMGGALLVYALAYRFVSRRGRPLLDARVHLPEERRITPRLLIGSLIFGAGWGVSGFCPGPALVSLGAFSLSTFVFVATMLAGSFLVRYAERAPQKVRRGSAREHARAVS